MVPGHLILLMSCFICLVGSLLSWSVIHFKQCAQVIAKLWAYCYHWQHFSQWSRRSEGEILAPQWPHQVYQIFFIPLWENKSRKELDSREDRGDERMDWGLVGTQQDLLTVLPLLMQLLFLHGWKLHVQSANKKWTLTSFCCNHFHGLMGLNKPHHEIWFCCLMLNKVRQPFFQFQDDWLPSTLRSSTSYIVLFLHKMITQLLPSLCMCLSVQS